MSVELTEDQRQAVRRGEAVRLVLGDLGEVFLVPAAALGETQNEQLEKEQWAQLARKAASRRAAENAF